MTFAAVLAVLVAVGPILELDAAAINALAPLIHQQLMKPHKKRQQVRIAPAPPASMSTCYHFRCG
jgi:hypothetical protein